VTVLAPFNASRVMGNDHLAERRPDFGGSSCVDQVSSPASRETRQRIQLAGLSYVFPGAWSHCCRTPSFITATRSPKRPSPPPGRGVT